MNVCLDWLLFFVEDDVSKVMGVFFDFACTSYC